VIERRVFFIYDSAKTQPALGYTHIVTNNFLTYKSQVEEPNEFFEFAYYMRSSRYIVAQKSTTTTSKSFIRTYFVNNGHNVERLTDTKGVTNGEWDEFHRV
jgi:hypothetical protein